jgi:hypothetical protein
VNRNLPEPCRPSDMMFVLLYGSIVAASVALLVNSFLPTSMLLREGSLSFSIVMDGVRLVDPVSLFSTLA